MSTETGNGHRTIRRHTKAHLGSGPKGNVPKISAARGTLRTCACGCGEPVSPTARFKRGHYRNDGHEQRECRSCGRTFKIVKTAARDVCRNRNCQGVWSENAGRRYEDKQRRLNETMRQIRGNWTIEERRIMRARRSVYTQLNARRVERDERLRQIDETLRRNAAERERQTDQWLSSLSRDDRSAALELLTAQQRDERRVQIQYEASLDKPNDDGTEAPAKRGGVVFDREDDMWPYIAERAKRANSQRIMRRRYNAGDEDYRKKDEAIATFRSRKSSALSRGTS